VDYLSFLLALLFSFIWFLISLFSSAYFSGTHAKTRFYVFFLSTLGHVMGVVVAGDLFSFFLFFELMTFSAYVLFIHHQTAKAFQAGMIYIFMGVLGGIVPPHGHIPDLPQPGHPGNGAYAGKP
jgi:hydrogenase-4 component B